MIATNFNPRTPRGVRRDILRHNRKLVQFQSTHPARGATLRDGGSTQHQHNFNPRTPRGVRREDVDNCPVNTKISIHAPREGCDHGLKRKNLAGTIISIHAPREGCDLHTRLVWWCQWISIHAPREGCDMSISSILLSHSLFQSTHPARGATRIPWMFGPVPILFQSTHPARGAT